MTRGAGCAPRACPGFDAAGGARLAGYTITCRDLTEQKQSEAERERVRRENERLLGALLEAGTRGHAFLHEFLVRLCGGRLFLCEDDTDLPAPLPALAPSFHCTPLLSCARCEKASRSPRRI
jgi:hypothetical protein